MKTKMNKERQQLYEKTGLWGDRTLFDYWNETVRQFADREYIVDNVGARLTYSELDQKADILASWMKHAGVKTGDMVTLQVTPRSEFVMIVYACLKLGAVLVPFKMRTGEAEWIRLMKKIKSRMHFYMDTYHGEDMGSFVRRNEQELDYDIINVCVGQKKTCQAEYNFASIMQGNGEKLPVPDVSANDVAVILFTSGTTKGSRGVLLTHNNIISSEKIFDRALELDCDDIMFMPAPLSHATGFHHGIISTMLHGGKLVLMDKYQVDEALNIMEEEKCTYSMGATPFIFDYVKKMDEGRKKPGSLKFFICGGAPVPYELTRRAWEKHRLMICECYGSTESVPHILVPPDRALDVKGKWSGKVLDGIEVRVVDENGKDVVPGEVGEEISRGPNVFVGYLDEPESTEQVLDDDGWYYSGDYCYADENGNVKICGRKKDIIVRGGENLNINEIEANLEGCPGILRYAVVGMPDERLGERVCAFIVPTDGYQPVTKDEVVDYLKSKKVSKWLLPERIEYIDDIPYTESGKIQRYLLKMELNKRLKGEKTVKETGDAQIWNDKNRYGHLRHRAIKKPAVECPPIRFFRCRKCGNLFSSMSVLGDGSLPVCCNEAMEELIPKPADTFEDIKLSYRIFGSLNENAIKATWECEDWNEKPVWIWLRTFTGGQLKYVSERKRSPLLFGLADEDAYAYCDKDPCVECTFRCKRGFGLYYYFEKRGLLYLQLERMSARQQTKNNGVPLDEILRREGRLS